VGTLRLRRLESVNATVVLALVFAVLLGLEWRYRLKSLRMGAALLAASVLLFYAPPGTTAAARRALELPASQRVIVLAGGVRLSEYASGVRTMEWAIIEAWRAYFGPNLVAVIVLGWLACSPVLWDWRARSVGSSRARERLNVAR
jgi:hypothetical protein